MANLITGFRRAGQARGAARLPRAGLRRTVEPRRGLSCCPGGRHPGGNDVQGIVRRADHAVPQRQASTRPRSRSWCRWQVGQGTHGLVPCGTTGESPALADDEHERVIALCVEAANGTGSGHRRHRHQLDRSHDRTDPAGQGRRRRRGADRLPLLQQADAGRALPAFQGGARRGRPADRDLQHSRPLGGRHDAMRRWRGSPNCRTSSGSRTRPTTSPGRCGCGSRSAANFAMLSGEDATAVAYLAQGGDGCISVTANVAPRLLADMHEAWQRGRSRDRAADQRTADPAARRAVRRDQPGARSNMPPRCSANASRRCACRCARSCRRRKSG